MTTNGESSAAKRRRTEDLGNDEASNESPVVEMPTLLWDILISNVKNIKLLKKCRLVCKGWNVAASRILRKRSIVVLDESKNLENFKVILANRAFGSLASMPSPFQNFHVIPTYFHDDFFKSLIHLTSFHTTDLSLTLENRTPDLDQYQLEVFLDSKMLEITDLSIKGKQGFYLDEELIAREDIQLTSLKRLVFTDECHPNCSHIPLMKNILRNSCLEFVWMSLRDSEVLIRLFTFENLKNVTVLNLAFVDLSTEAWNTLANLSLPYLKKLRVENTDLENAKTHASQFSALIENVSRTIESLQTQFIRMELLPVLPKLQELELWKWENKVSQFTPKQLPSLKNICIRVRGTIWKFLENNFEPHTKVTTLLVGIDMEAQDSLNSIEKQLPIFLTYLSRQFPKLMFLCLDLPKFTTETFCNIYQSLPKLKKLGIKASCSFPHMSGTDVSIINYYLDAGWPMENIPRRNSIHDFTELNQLFLGRKVVVTPDMLTYCISKIRKLRSLEFYWNPELSVASVSDCLDKLGRIIIYNLTSDQATMDELQKVLTNVYFC